MTNENSRIFLELMQMLPPEEVMRLMRKENPAPQGVGAPPMQARTAGMQPSGIRPRPTGIYGQSTY